MVMMQPLIGSKSHSKSFRPPWILHVRCRLFVTILLAATVVVQLLLYTLLYKPDYIYSRVPTLRSYWLNCKQNKYEQLPTIYVITPTYSRHVQIADLTSLSHTLMLVPNVHWIIVEDSETKKPRLMRFIDKLKTEFNFKSITHLNEPTRQYSQADQRLSRYRPKGVRQRNKALDWLRDNIDSLDKRGIVYFADDDNTYDIELFQEMRSTRRVSVWPVAFAGGLLVERPIAAQNRVTGFNAMYFKSRRFPIDMAGFAVSLDFLISKPNVAFDDKASGQIESEFLKLLVDSWEDLEPKADNCREILVWHTHTKVPNLSLEGKASYPSTSGTDF